MNRRALTAFRRSPSPGHQPGDTLLLTMRLAGSLSSAAEEALGQRFSGHGGPAALADPDQRKRYFAAWDAALNEAKSGPAWLRTGAVARQVRDQLDAGAARGLWGLLAWTLLPNHLHVLMRLPEVPPVPLSRALQHFKSRTAQLANDRLGRDGAFWEPADDALPIRDEPEAISRVVRYVALDPVRAGLARRWDEWPHTWVTDEYWQAEW